MQDGDGIDTVSKVCVPWKPPFSKQEVKPLMNPVEFRSVLRQTFSDQKISRAERQALVAVIEEMQPAETQLDLYRHEAFDLARAELLAEAPANVVIDWLEDVVRLLKAGQDENQPITSEAYFSPGNACRQRIRSLFRQARSTVDICVFTITDDEIVEVIAESHNRGVQIRVISDNDKSNDLGSDIDRLAEHGIAVRIDRSPYHMHHKFAIFDRSILLSGSYNWTRSAADNNEENITVQNDKHLIKVFGQVFEDLWEQYR